MIEKIPVEVPEKKQPASKIVAAASDLAAMTLRRTIQQGISPRLATSSEPATDDGATNQQKPDSAK